MFDDCENGSLLWVNSLDVPSRNRARVRASSSDLHTNLTRSHIYREITNSKKMVYVHQNYRPLPFDRLPHFSIRIVFCKKNDIICKIYRVKTHWNRIVAKNICVFVYEITSMTKILYGLHSDTIFGDHKLLLSDFGETFAVSPILRLWF